MTENIQDIFAEEAFVVDTQCLLHTTMLDKNISRADLAKSLNLLVSDVNKIFSDDCEVDIRLLFKAFYAMGATIKIGINNDASRFVAGINNG